MTRDPVAVNERSRIDVVDRCRSGRARPSRFVSRIISFRIQFQARINRIRYSACCRVPGPLLTRRLEFLRLSSGLLSHNIYIRYFNCVVVCQIPSKLIFDRLCNIRFGGRAGSGAWGQARGVKARGVRRAVSGLAFCTPGPSRRQTVPFVQKARPDTAARWPCRPRPVRAGAAGASTASSDTRRRARAVTGRSRQARWNGKCAGRGHRRGLDGPTMPKPLPKRSTLSPRQSAERGGGDGWPR